jgi:hypothetical protein
MQDEIRMLPGHELNRLSVQYCRSGEGTASLREVLRVDYADS